MLRTILLALGCAFVLAPTVARADLVGDTITAAGGSEFTSRAADAIADTCQDLVVQNQSTPLAGAQMDLLGRCREMTQSSYDFYNLPSLPTQFSYGFSSESDLYSAIRQFSGEEGSSNTRFATENTNRQFAAIGARLDAIRRGARSMSSGIAFNEAGTPLILGGAASADDADSGWGWFTNANLGFGDRDATENEDEYDFDSYGATIGVDYVLASGLVLGAAVGYADYEVDFDDRGAAVVSDVSGGSVESDGYTVSAFASYASERMYFDGIVSVGANDFDLERRAVFTAPAPTDPSVGDVNRTFTAETESDNIGAQVTAGLVLGQGATTWDLYVGADYLSIEVDGYTEDDSSAGGGLALEFDGQDVDSVQSILGVMLRHSINSGFGVVVPYGGAEWRHEFDNDPGSLVYRYAFALESDPSGDGISNPSFESPVDDPDEDFLNLTLGLSAQFANNLFAFLQYDSALLIEDTTANRITVGLRGTF